MDAEPKFESILMGYLRLRKDLSAEKLPELEKRNWDAVSRFESILIKYLQLRKKMSAPRRFKPEQRNRQFVSEAKKRERDRMIAKLAEELVNLDFQAFERNDFTRYLMQEMPEEERSEFEDRYLENPELFERIIDAENDMMRSYVRGEGSEAERAAFETRYLGTMEGRQRVDFARSLMNYVDSVHEIAPSATGQEEPQPPAPLRWWRKPVLFIAALDPVRLAAAIAIVALLAGVSWLMVMDSSLRHGLKQMQDQHAGDLRREQDLRVQLTDTQARLQQQEQQLEQLSVLGASIVPYTPAPRLVRGTSPRKPLEIRQGVSAVFLQPVLEKNGYPGYAATIDTPEGRRIWRQAYLRSWPLRNGRYSIGLILPARILESGNYILTLKGKTAEGKTEEVESYVFRVVDRRTDQT